MTSGLFGSLIASLRKLVESLFYYKPKVKKMLTNK